MDWNPDPKILAAIENGVAASRWRIAARFERANEAARFNRMADHRSAAATAILTDLTTAGRDQPAGHRSTHRTAQGG